MKTLSLIIPSYNMEQYLPKCLGSLVIDAEHMEKLEVLVVNDGSKDRTSEIAHEFEAKWPGTFKVIDKPNGNYGSCINAALPVAQGTWVKVLDADDWFKTENLSDYLEFLEKKWEGVDLVLSDYDMFDYDGKMIRNCRWRLPCNEDFAFSVFVLNDEVGLSMHAYTYRTEHLRKLNYFQTEGVSYSDTEWIVIPLIGIARVAYYGRSLYQYLYGRPGQTMDSRLFLKNFPMRTAIALHMVGSFSSLAIGREEESYLYVRQKIVSYIEGIFRVALFGLSGKRVRIDLEGFDCALKDLSPELYLLCDQRRYSRWLRCRFIKAWRQHSPWGGFVLCCCRAYTRLIRECARGMR